MSEEKKQKSKNQETTPTASGGYQTPIEADIRKTGTAAQSDARESAKPEATGEDDVAGSPNQGTPSR
ncbi:MULTISPECIES: hypothetical protein [unclassified Anabaena]|uniref:hypothetical protein n=1 Tax=unclassified Anabaena TaxID=2619674 RepID=UPI00082B8993|nr:MULTISPECIES: hypothetical protein [unclassified Anabaena]